MNKKQLKILYFKYFIYKTMEKIKKDWLYCDEIKYNRRYWLNNLFILIIRNNSSNSENKLLDIFDNFVSLPYWPTELDIYKYIQSFWGYKFDDQQKEKVKWYVASGCFKAIWQSLKSEWIDKLNKSVIELIDKSIDNNAEFLSMKEDKIVEHNQECISWIIWRRNPDRNMQDKFIIMDRLRY